MSLLTRRQVVSQQLGNQLKYFTLQLGRTRVLRCNGRTLLHDSFDWLVVKTFLHKSIAAKMRSETFFLSRAEHPDFLNLDLASWIK